MVALIDSVEILHQEAVRQKGFLWTLEPLWFTWSFQSFGSPSFGTLGLMSLT